MIKLNLGKSLEQRKALCNFCGDDKVKPCIKSSVPLEINFKKTELKKIIDDYEYEVPFWGESYRKIIGDIKYGWVESGEYEKINRNIDICEDCVMQLAKLLSQSRPNGK